MNWLVVLIEGLGWAAGLLAVAFGGWPRRVGVLGALAAAAALAALADDQVGARLAGGAALLSAGEAAWRVRLWVRRRAPRSRPARSPGAALDPQGVVRW